MSKSYESDITFFIREYNKNNPLLRKQQVDGRNILWDRKLETDLLKEFDLSRVSQKSYVYQTD
ncbi:conserved hypothetical protein of the DUF3460 family [Candidatus Kinetoplastibacterium oncopeltii TCC290E]|uniref:DUF3460 family protein n=1 Tax=Candidatus Kinetoplastidibacterium stringomonadis TCC290E TaxID=1208920 RepID=M1M9H2_9PROT|nr:DUF3460 family protein [Candidatus Kinetoplastibacterium oncopeltii]AGF48605.1 conserved hypothetical protein of the DUF3460 family [Candidatus Kinetoplastibacterium oncopeltii TCC290E]